MKALLESFTAPSGLSDEQGIQRACDYRAGGEHAKPRSRSFAFNASVHGWGLAYYEQEPGWETP